MSWPWWFTRSDAEILVGAWMLTAVGFALLGILNANAVISLAVGALLFVGFCWYTNEPGEDVEASA
ncbi:MULTISPECIES: hypothetical protein [Halorussus]|uniref:hypothetical protein n=1 Tax=Halorussus TaxID=1070314 RepID=UPI0013B36385|nr:MULTISPECIES: hypothetical protein [Halorussus]NHN59816.1 hypothetical protein [Halorussus sp. JP-T4]